MAHVVIRAFPSQLGSACILKSGLGLLRLSIWKSDRIHGHRRPDFPSGLWYQLCSRRHACTEWCGSCVSPSLYRQMFDHIRLPGCWLCQWRVLPEVKCGPYDDQLEHKQRTHRLWRSRIVGNSHVKWSSYIDDGWLLGAR